MSCLSSKRKLFGIRIISGGASAVLTDMKPLVMDVVSGFTTGATIGWILGAIIRVVHKHRVVAAANDTRMINARAASHARISARAASHARIVDKWGFSTLQWPTCVREGNGILFTGYIKRRCMCIAPLEQSGSANSFFQRTYLSND